MSDFAVHLVRRNAAGCPIIRLEARETTKLKKLGDVNHGPTLVVS